MLKGCDISRYQGVVNWDLLRQSLDFVIMKASTGCPDPGQSYISYRDAQFSRNQSEARRVGMLRGYYHFARPDVNGGRAEDEANCFCDNVGKLQEGEILVLDYETDSSQDQVDWSLRFLNTCYQRTGVRPLLYIDLGRNNAANWSPVVNANYGLWIARWDYNPDAAQPNTDWPFAAMRQYSNKGNVAGISPLDLDVFYGNADQYRAYGYHEIVTPVDPPEVPDPKDLIIAELTANVKTLTEQVNVLTSDKNALETNVEALKTQVKLLQDELLKKPLDVPIEVKTINDYSKYELFVAWILKVFKRKG